MPALFPLPDQTPFSIHNLPFGVFSTADQPVRRIGVALGDFIIDLAAMSSVSLLDELDFDPEVLQLPTLNAFAALGKTPRQRLRQRLQEMFSDPKGAFVSLMDHFLVPMSAATLHLPIQIGDYTDFYSSEEHATNVGKMFRDPANALLPNWKHLPVAYHGRASSICVSGTPFHRPQGQTRPDEQAPPVFGPTKRLDFELEVAAVIGQPTALGESVRAADAEDHIFGFVLFNDWSARDIQKWEYVPLGPFLAKNFFSSISPWIVTPEALEPFRVQAPPQDPPVLPYLQCSGPRHFDIPLEVAIRPPGSDRETVVTRSNFKHLYWSVAQQIAHHTVNGCNLQAGDVLASGTISGPEPESFGSMLERTWGGKTPLTLTDGTERAFIEDGDTVIIRATAQKGDICVGFGEVANRVLPVRERG
jgi:fumarylacetoacetase